jgi:hypothetical protein
MFKESVLTFTALATSTVANAHAASAVVISDNGFYGAAWGPLLNTDRIFGSGI